MKVESEPYWAYVLECVCGLTKYWHFWQTWTWNTCAKGFGNSYIRYDHMHVMCGGCALVCVWRYLMHFIALTNVNWSCLGVKVANMNEFVRMCYSACVSVNSKHCQHESAYATWECCSSELWHLYKYVQHMIMRTVSLSLCLSVSLSLSIPSISLCVWACVGVCVCAREFFLADHASSEPWIPRSPSRSPWVTPTHTHTHTHILNHASPPSHTHTHSYTH